jgi:hypothetical protein
LHTGQCPLPVREAVVPRVSLLAPRDLPTVRVLSPPAWVASIVVLEQRLDEELHLKHGFDELVVGFH